MKPIERLITQFAGPALCPPPPLKDQAMGGRSGDLFAALVKRNGFYAFESALHMIPLGGGCTPFDIVKWNLPDLWKSHYARHQFQGITCFAMNLFGDQFFFDDKGFGRMDSETGEIEFIGHSLDDWAHAIMTDANYHLGWSLAHAWQQQNGAIEPGKRLVPKRPFISGGEFDVANLYQIDSLKAMKFRGDIATQLHDVPDGSTIRPVSAE